MVQPPSVAGLPDHVDVRHAGRRWHLHFPVAIEMSGQGEDLRAVENRRGEVEVRAYVPRLADRGVELPGSALGRSFPLGPPIAGGAEALVAGEDPQLVTGRNRGGA